MEIAAISVVVLVAFAVLGVLAGSRMRAREADRAIRHEKLEVVVDGHREMVAAHAVAVEELRPRAQATEQERERV